MFAGVINVIASVLAFNGINNMPVLHLYTILELVLVLRFFSIVITGKKAVWSIYGIKWLFPVFCIINFICFESVFMFNSYTRAFEAIIIIIFCMIYFKEVLDSSPNVFRSYSVTLAVVGFLIYFSGSFFHFTFSNYISYLVKYELKMIIWNIHATLVLIMYSLFTLAFIYAKADR
ncbi:hypothetical protein [Pedobacter metabolipauper]|uniref:hypothetical protein n=1 Tax=Pedobacter metabolipauper TaxID=425513 RepID=UPI00105F98AD|nr:hypothetical protein [Pedobacter metabolipauper]